MTHFPWNFQEDLIPQRKKHVFDIFVLDDIYIICYTHFLSVPNIDMDLLDLMEVGNLHFLPYLEIAKFPFKNT